jgi:hypothetical protein
MSFEVSEGDYAECYADSDTVDNACRIPGAAASPSSRLGIATRS